MPQRDFELDDDKQPPSIGPDEWVDADSWAQSTWITLCSLGGICMWCSEIEWAIRLLILANLAHHFHLWHLRLRCRKWRT